MRLLALDLGTKTGWALLDNDGSVRSGTWTLGTDKELAQAKAMKLDRCCDFRPSRLFDRINELKPELIYFEDVQFASTQLQAQLWGSLRGIVTLFFPAAKIRAVPVGTLKKFATGKGNALKPAMAAALEKAPGFFMGVTRRGKPQLFKTPTLVDVITAAQQAIPVDDNEVDAIHLLNFARKELNV
jgi:Holliday junction resolvasome RuvABC endonuclease subunit